MEMATRREMGFVLKSVNNAESLTGNVCKSLTPPFFFILVLVMDFSFLLVSEREYIGMNTLYRTLLRTERVLGGEIWTVELKGR
jgi:hypothetical protein